MISLVFTFLGLLILNFVQFMTTKWGTLQGAYTISGALWQDSAPGLSRVFFNIQKSRSGHFIQIIEENGVIPRICANKSNKFHRPQFKQGSARGYGQKSCRVSLCNNQSLDRLAPDKPPVNELCTDKTRYPLLGIYLAQRP